jgi:5-formyltetrahydrofolate cyclo-ligase
MIFINELLVQFIMVLLTKAQVRQHILNIRNNEQGSSDIKQIVDRFFEYIKLKPQDVVAGYYPIGSEINILPILEKLSTQGHKTLLPVVELSDSSLSFYPWVQGESVEVSQYASKILEPVNRDKNITPSVVVSPLIACDIQGNRIGSGKGIYDRYISHLRALKIPVLYIGMCYDFQLLESIPSESHDQKLDVIITDKRLIRL